MKDNVVSGMVFFLKLLMVAFGLNMRFRANGIGHLLEYLMLFSILTCSHQVTISSQKLDVINLLLYRPTTLPLLSVLLFISLTPPNNLFQGNALLLFFTHG